MLNLRVKLFNYNEQIAVHKTVLEHFQLNCLLWAGVCCDMKYVTGEFRRERKKPPLTGLLILYTVLVLYNFYDEL